MGFLVHPKSDDEVAARIAEVQRLRSELDQLRNVIRQIVREELRQVRVVHTTSARLDGPDPLSLTIKHFEDP